MFRVLVTLQTFTHEERGRFRGERHGVDFTVTTGAADPVRDVHAVIEIDEIGQVVDSGPLERVLRFQTLTNGS